MIFQRLRAFKTCFCLAFLFAIATVTSVAQPQTSPDTRSRISSLIDDLAKVQTIHQVAISPDGALLAWTVSDANGTTHLHLTSLAEPTTNRLISIAPQASHCADASPAWSPDGKQLAFLSDCATPDQSQLYTFDLKNGQVRKLTEVKGFLESPAWSPDGRSIAFLFVENATRPSGALAAMKPPSGVIGEDGIEIQRVAVADVANATVRSITPPKLHVYEFDWAPNSHELAYVAAPPPGENNWWIAQLYTQPYLFGGKAGAVDTKATATATSILNPATISGPLHGLQIAVPRWSPDGKQIAFIGGLMSDQGFTGGDIYLLPSSGGQPKNITAGRKASPAWITWLDSSSLGVTEYTGGSSHITALDAATGQPSTKHPIDETLPAAIGSGQASMSLSLSQGAKTIALIRSSFNHPPEVWAGPLTHLQQITHVNDELKRAWGKTENIEWTNEGFHVQGWLLYPAHYDPAKKYPLITMVHGGPSSAVTPHWPGVGYGGAPFSAMGYFVFMPNPRGSYGQGEKFTQANIKDFGHGDLRDILAGLDSIEKRLPVDPNRIGLTGWSYGGFMTMFDVTQTNRFKAAVAGAGISDWKSYYGENSIDQWMIPFFGASVYDDPAVYAKSSAINFIKNVKTPMLIVVGDRDGECPAPQSFEMWHALRAQGVPTRLVVYPDEGHAFHNPEHRKDVLVRAIEWFEQYMPAKE
ncbi:MAG: S9 family peptidase [Acidobacteriaceae bacterium]